MRVPTMPLTLQSIRMNAYERGLSMPAVDFKLIGEAIKPALGPALFKLGEIAITQFIESRERIKSIEINQSAINDSFEEGYKKGFLEGSKKTMKKRKKASTKKQ
jgi:hypothetical protein